MVKGIYVSNIFFFYFLSLGVYSHYLSLCNQITNYFLLIYSEKFGLYNIDFTQPTRPRVAKKSANFMKEVIRTHSVSINEYLR